MKQGNFAQDTRPFENLEVAIRFDNYPEAVRVKLLALRQLIYETAAVTEGVGQLEETLKWGQPSYLTHKPKSGTTIRIDSADEQTGRYGLYVHCQTNLVETFRTLYPHEFTYEGNRAIIFDAEADWPVTALQHCIALALTYHQRKKG